MKSSSSRKPVAAPPTISIVTPAYNEAGNMAPFYRAVCAVFSNLPYTAELIIVDDGSRDGTAAAVRQLKPCAGVSLRFLQLSRNFGKEVAVTAGLHQATGAATIILDADLQHPPKYIPQFIDRWQAGADVVVGVRSHNEHESFIKKWGSKLFYQLMGRISDVELVPHSTDYRLLDRQVTDEFCRFTERSRITRGLIDWLGFKRDYVYFKAEERMHGKASYDARKLIKLAFHSITAHSLFPLRLAGYLGVVLTLLAGLLGVFIIVEKYILDDPLGWQISNVTALAVFTVFLIGIVMSCLGLIAMYIAAIHAEVSNRPLFVLRRQRPGETGEIVEAGQEPLT